MIEIQLSTLEARIESGELRRSLVEELVTGFEAQLREGAPLAPASYYAARIAEAAKQAADGPIATEQAFHLYQEILAACEEARARLLSA